MEKYIIIIIIILIIIIIIIKLCVQKAEDYNGPREADGLVEFALKSLDAAGAPVTLTQLTSKDDLDSLGSKKLLSLLFLPHILDSGASGRNKYLETFANVAK